MTTSAIHTSSSGSAFGVNAFREAREGGSGSASAGSSRSRPARDVPARTGEPARTGGGRPARATADRTGPPAARTRDTNPGSTRAGSGREDAAAARRTPRADAPAPTASGAATTAVASRSRRRRGRGAGSADRPAAQVVAGPTVAAPAEPGFAVEEVTDPRGFAELGVPQALLAPLAELGAQHPFPIQSATLPTALAGRDLLGRGRTGSGKTIAFAVPLVARLTDGRRQARRPRGLVLLPTRELALQVQRTIAPLAAAAGLTTCVVFGGVGFGPQIEALRRGVDIVVACPGRLEDLIARGACDLGGVEVTVLDEADHMAGLGFLPVVRRLLRATPRNGQRLLFSATLDREISVLADDFLTDPVVHSIAEAPVEVAKVDHHVFVVDAGDRAAVVRELAGGTGSRILFTRTKHAARKWAAALAKSGIAAVDLHGNLGQNARERNLAAFSSGAATVLVATDIAARGIHVDDIELVVHVDPPAEHKAYTHRSGRTARAGAEGVVVTLTLPEQADEVRTLLRQAAVTATTTRIRPGQTAAALAG